MINKLHGFASIHIIHIFACKLRANNHNSSIYKNMNTSIKISLDTRREKKDGSYPIILRLAHGRNTIPISLGYSVPENDWDDSSGKIKKTYKGISNVTRLNNLIQKRKANALDIITQLLDSGEIQLPNNKRTKR